MKTKRIQKIGIVLGIILVGALAGAAIYHAVMVARAEETLFGIGTLISEVQEEGKEYTILEIVPDERAAEIGYLVPGCEPALSVRDAQTGTWKSWEEGLGSYTSAEERAAYMNGLVEQWNAFLQRYGFTAQNAPVGYETYEESDTAQDGFRELAFEEQTYQGYFEVYGSGGVSGTERYDLTFFPDGSVADLSSDARVQHYYAVSERLTADRLASLSDDTELYVSSGGKNGPFAKAGTWAELKDGILASVSSGDTGGDAGSVSGGDAGGSGTDGGDAGDVASQELDYYLVQFAPLLADTTLADETPVYAVDTESMVSSDAGRYQFTHSDTGFSYTFGTDKIYYRGGFVNRYWLHDSVLNLEESEYDTVPVRVITLTVAEFNAMQEQPACDMVYLNSGASASEMENFTAYGAGNDLEKDKADALFADIVSAQKPCILDAGILYNVADGTVQVDSAMKSTNLFRLCASLSQDSPSALLGATKTTDELLEGVLEGTDRNFVTENVYSFLSPTALTPGGLIDSTFTTASIGSGEDAEQVAEGFRDVWDEITTENLYRSADVSGAYEQLPTQISRATVVRHVMNYRYRRDVEVKKNIRVLEIQPCKSDSNSYDLTEEEVKSWAPGVETVTIDRVTTAEFIGHIEDINEIYDLVYIGTDKDHLNTDASGSTVFNDSAMNGLIYYHTGDIRYTSMELVGQLDTEYTDGSARGGDVYYYNPVRYGGNDITLEKKNSLLSFLDASYPIIVSDEFFQYPATVYQNYGFGSDPNAGGYAVPLREGRYTLADLEALGVQNDDITSFRVKPGYRITLYWDDNFQGESLTVNGEATFYNLADIGASSGDNWNDKASSLVVERIPGADVSRKIDTDHIDNSSYLYDFVEEAMQKNSFYARSDIGEDSQLFEFYLNRPKVYVNLLSANGTQDASTGIYQIPPYSGSRYLLEYHFTISNEGAASVDTQYQCELFIDVNADGKYSESEMLEDISITYNGQTVSPDQLYAGREYVLRRYVPDGYKGVLPWKLQISQKNNPNIHNAVSGYTKLLGLERETLKILQIGRDKITDTRNEWNTWWGGENERLFSLAEKIADPSDIYHILIYGGTYDGVTYPGIYDDFNIEADFMTISQFEAAFAENENILEDEGYNMLILGFSDAYGDFTGGADSGPVGAIIDFINSGKSVLFAHDTVSYWNYAQYNADGTERNGVTDRTSWAKDLTNQYRSSYNLTRNIRQLVGMDRYGITTYGPLKTGVGLAAGTDAWQGMLNAGKDIPYQAKSDKTQTVAETQGYTYSIINAKDGGNRGYFSAAETGRGDFNNTYLNLKYGTVYYNDNAEDAGVAPHDEGEIPLNYNGAVENLLVTRVNSGQITDYPYRLADEFEVACTHGQYYQLDFTADDDRDGQSDLVVWYCLGGRMSGNTKQETIYSVSPNDVSNNYYIYNKGNITYTGMGHSANQDVTSTVEEAKLFINTIIASYNAGLKDPVITTLSDGSSTAQEVSSANRYFDDTNDLSLDNAADTSGFDSRYERIYFTVNDLNFIKGTRRIALNCFYEAEDGDRTITYDGKEVKLKELPAQIYSASDDALLEDHTNLVSGKVYYLLIDRAVMGDYDTKFSVYFEGETTISTYNRVMTTGKVYRRFDFMRVHLFDLK